MKYDLSEDNARNEEVIHDIATRNHVAYFSAINVLCNADGCLNRTGPSPSDLTSIDDWHITKGAADLIIEKLAPQLFNKLN